MGLLSFGGSKSKSVSQSSSLDLAANVSSSLSESLAQSLSQSRGQSTSTQSVWNADLLERLYGDALGAVSGAEGQLFTGQAAGLFSSGLGILEQLGTGAGEDYLRSRLEGGELLEAQIGGLREDVGRLFREELNPAITGGAVAAGQLGGGRQGVAQGRAAEVAARTFTRGATELRAQDQAMRDSAAAQLMQGRTGAAGAAASLLPQLLGTAQAGATGGLAPFAALASIIGGPTVLTQGQSTDESQATSESIARAISEALGYSYGTSSSSSSSKSKSLSLGFGGG